MFSGISGISNNSFYSTVSAMNTLKFQQVMNSKSGAGVSSISSIGKTLDSDSATFLKNYQSALTDMMSAANALRDGGKDQDAYGVSSSDSKVADVKAKFKLNAAAEYELDVKQLATAQTNRSAGVDANGKPVSGGTLTITGANGESALFVADPTAKSNREQLTEMAKQINRRKAGYTAKVVENEGKVSLEITGQETGKNSTFSIGGEFAERTGLSAASQRAQDAVYTVDKGDGRGAVEYTSSSNTVTVGDYRVEATLKKEGSTTVTVGTDTRASADSIQKLVNSFNKTLSLLNSNSDRGVGVLAQMRRMVGSPASEKSMNMIGISVKADGSLSFDANTFADMMEKQPKLANDIVKEVAQGVYQDARQGMNASSASLLGSNGSSSSSGGNALANWQLQSQQNPLNFMSAYAKSGAYNLMNYYAVGAFMNIGI